MTTLLEDITSRDPQRVWASSCAIITLREQSELQQLAAHIPEIVAATTHLDLGGALFPNREHLAFALRKLEFVKNNGGCLCQLYPQYIMYDPQKEEKAGNIQITDTRSDAVNWVDTYLCQCNHCHTTYQVESREYHYTWWEWKPFPI